MAKCLSLFGGMECGRIALEVLGIPVESYHSSEFDPYPQKLSGANFPDIVHIGDVTKVSGYDYPDTDILFAGPPCQDLSIAGKRKGLAGERSGLFYEVPRIINETKPRFFIIENVASMPKEAKDEMVRNLWGIEPVLINSALLSAQNRKRLYFVGKRNDDGTYSRFDTPEPEDRGIVLKDILEDIPFDATNAKCEPVWKPVPEKFLAVIAEKIAKFEKSKRDGCISLFNTNPSGKGMNGNAFYSVAKGPTVTTNKGEGNKVVVPVIGQFRRTDLRIHAEQDKVCTLTANMGTGRNNVPVILEPYCLNPQVDGKQPSLADRIYHDEAKATAVTTSFITNVVRIPEATNRGFVEVEPGQCVDMAQANSKTRRGRLMVDKANALTCAPDFRLDEAEVTRYLWRKLTVRECARLQTVPEWYSFDSVSNSRAYKAIGNGWTVEVICHILRHMNIHG